MAGQRQAHLRQAGHARHTQQAGGPVAVVLQFGIGLTDPRRHIGHGGHQEHAVSAQDLLHVRAPAFAKSPRLCHLIVRDFGRPIKTLGHRSPQHRLETLKKTTMHIPSLSPLYGAEMPVHGVHVCVHDTYRLGLAQTLLYFLTHRLQSFEGPWRGQRPHVGGGQHADLIGQGLRILAQQDIRHTGKSGHIAGKPTTSVQTGRQGHGVLQTDAAVAGPDAHQTAMVRRGTHRAAGV